jgi:CRP/FNR family transcriptional regulator, cyclic AMP receptor protein
MSADVKMIGEVPIFELMDEDEREALARLMDSRNFKQGETIFETGDAGAEIYIVRSGRVEIYVENPDGEKVVLGENEHGDVIGELSFLDGGARTATATAVEDTQMLSLHRERLLEFIDEHPHAALDLLTVVGRRLRTTHELLRTQVSRNVNVEEQERLTFAERVADRVATFGGSWSFILIFFGIMLVWIILNSTAMLRDHFDPYPYILLNLALSMIAAIQAPVIMMSQNRQAAKDRLKSDLDYQVNFKAELEVATLHRKVDRMYERLEAHLCRLESSNHDPSISGHH